MLKEFKEFIARGNVMDLAVGVIIGGAFGKIVTSLVGDIIMPVIGVIIGGIDFTGLTVKIGNAEIKYGSFIQNVLDFLIIAFCIFMLVRTVNKFMSRIHKEPEEKLEEKQKKSDEVLLLEEIRDLLKKEEVKE